MRSALLLFLLLLISQNAQAKKFNLDKGKIAPYFKGHFGNSQVARDGFAGNSGNAVFTETTEFEYAGELGLFLQSNKVGFRIGVQGIYPQKMDNIEARNAAGIVQYNLTSRILGVFPVAHLEYSPVLDAEKRFYFSIGGGVGTVTVLNDYRFTSASTYGLVDYTEESVAYPYMLEGAMGFEFSLADNATLFFDAGYRYLTVSEMKHNRDATTFTGAVTKGTVVRNVGGDKRELNLSSAFAGLGFKFYIP